MPEYELTASAFEGLRRRGHGSIAAFGETENMSLRNYPMLSSRRRREYVDLPPEWGHTKILGAVSRTVLLEGALRETLCLICRERLVYLFFEGDALRIQSFPCSLGDSEKQTVIMGAWLVIWPDKVRVHMASPGETEPLEQRVTLRGSELVLACQIPGVGWRYASYIQPEAPAHAAEGRLWADTSAVPIRLSRWSEEQGVWLEVSGEYRLALTAPAGTFQGFSAGDTVTLSGWTGLQPSWLSYRYTTSAGVSEREAEAIRGLEGLHRIDNMDAETFTFLSFDITIPTVYSLTLPEGAEITVTRAVPDMDFICECGNRLWGCRYGLDETGALLNELYCSKLGDCRNFHTYAGLSTDSWTAACGTDGPWTGCINLQGYPLFFKEHSVTRIYPSGIGAHRTVVTKLPGVQAGSRQSLVQFGDTAYYLGAGGVYAYDGSSPLCISAALGEPGFHSGAAGFAGTTLYLSARGADGEPGLYTCDILRGLWCREDKSDVSVFAALGSRLGAVCRNGTLFFTDAAEGTAEKSAPDPGEQTGAEGAETPCEKQAERREAPDWAVETLPICPGGRPEGCRAFGFRLRATPGKTLRLEISRDNGPRESAGVMQETLPGIYVCGGVPRRCGSFRLRLSGSGAIDIMTAALKVTAESEGTK